MSERFTLASLIGGRVAIEWYEAVALACEVAGRFVDDSGASVSAPELDQVYISSEGEVVIVGDEPADEPVRRLGQLLHALLANSEVPVQLRLVISQATAPSPTYKSVREYLEALSFFERPDRVAVLRGLAARAAMMSQPAALPDQALTLDTIAPLPSEEPPASKKRKRSSSRRRRRAWAVACVAVLVMALAGAAAWYADRRGLWDTQSIDVSSAADRASKAVGDALLSGASAVTERIGLGRIVPADAPPSPPPGAAPAPASTPPAKPGRRGAAAAPQEALPLRAFDLELATLPDAPEAVPPSTPPPVDEFVKADLPPSDEVIYSIESPAVTPPVGISPELARRLPPDLSMDKLGRIELVIARDGSVESVKLLGMPRNVRDSLFLSVVKAWTFQPARKDGAPVRYRKTIWVASPWPDLRTSAE